MTINRFLILMILGLNILGAQSCKRNTDDSGDTFDRTALLTDLLDKVILPAHEAVQQQSVDLVSATQTFTANPTQPNLDALRVSWRQTKRLWKHCEVFNIGEVSYQIIHNRIDKWPTNTNFIENFIATEDSIDAAFIDAAGSTSKGLPAMEYLIYNGAVLDSFTTAARVTQRKAYLNALAENLKNTLDELLLIWDASGSNYSDEFISSTQNGLIGSINMLVNQMIAVNELVLHPKIGNPSGIDNGNGPDTGLVETPYAQVSLNLIRENVLSLQTTFTGGLNASDVGFDDYLNHLGAKNGNVALRDTISGAFTVVLDRINDIQEPLADAISNNPTQVQALYDAVKQLLVLLKVDMVSSLGVTLTISDNDGD